MNVKADSMPSSLSTRFLQWLIWFCTKGNASRLVSEMPLFYQWAAPTSMRLSLSACLQLGLRFCPLYTGGGSWEACGRRCVASGLTHSLKRNTNTSYSLWLQHRHSWGSHIWIEIFSEWVTGLKDIPWDMVFQFSCGVKGVKWKTIAGSHVASSAARENGAGVIYLTLRCSWGKFCHNELLLKPQHCLVFDSGYSLLYHIPLLFRYSGQGPCLFLPRRSYKHTSNPEVLTLQGAFQKC